jgi:hypothetical protein
MIIEQLEIGYMENFSYIVGCENTRKALVIDPGRDVRPIVDKAQQHGLDNRHHPQHPFSRRPHRRQCGVEVSDRSEDHHPRA